MIERTKGTLSPRLTIAGNGECAGEWCRVEELEAAKRAVDFAVLAAQQAIERAEMAERERDAIRAEFDCYREHFQPCARS